MLSAGQWRVRVSLTWCRGGVVLTLSWSISACEALQDCVQHLATVSWGIKITY